MLEKRCFTRNDNHQPEGDVPAKNSKNILTCWIFNRSEKPCVSSLMAGSTLAKCPSLTGLIWCADRNQRLLSEQSTGAKLSGNLLVSFGSTARQENAGGVHQWSSPVAANWQDYGKFLPRQRGSCRMSSLFHTRLPLHWIGAASLLRPHVCLLGCMNLNQIRNQSANQWFVIPAIQGMCFNNCSAW